MAADDETTGRASVRVRVPAKINLALCVGPLGSDGYHPLGTAFQAVSLYDEVTATDAGPGRFSVTVTGEGAADVPGDDANLALRAARLLAGHNPRLGAHLGIRKAIPVAGGMAGGSADGAAALLACSVLWDLDQSLDDLQLLGSELGSDVPFPLHGGTAIGTRRGDRLLALLTRGTYHWVLAFAHGGLSTPAVFRRFDELGRITGTEIPPPLLNALAVGDAAALGRTLRNDLQPAALDLRPELAGTLERGLAAGALGGVISGSGPTCAFLASTESRALTLAADLSQLPQVRATRVAVGPVPGAKLLT